MRSETFPETYVVWCAACLSVLLAASAFVPWIPLRVFVIAGGAVLAATLAPAYARRATPVSAVVLTISGAVLSVSAIIRNSWFSWTTGISCSQLGGVHMPSAWLFTTTSWLLAIGLLAAGRLVAEQGRNSGDLGPRGYRLASALVAIAFLGFLMVGACPVGGSRALSVAHNLSAVSAMGAFCLGMASTSLLPGLSRSLKLYALAAMLIMLTAWFPTALRFLGLTQSSPISTRHMELLAFSLAFSWLAWVAWEWSARSPATE